MNRWHRLSRVALTLIAAAIVASVSVSAAEAGHGRGRGGYGTARYRGSSYRPAYTRRVVYSRPHYAYSRAYARPVYYRPAYGMYRVGRPVSGGYLAFGTGGLSFGFALSSRPSGYYYMDPYCNTRFSSLGAYQDHCHMHHHDVVVRVVHENAPGRVYQDYDRKDWNDSGPHEDWNGSGPHDDWNDGNDPNTNDDQNDGWNDKEERRDWNDSGDDDEDDGR